MPHQDRLERGIKAIAGKEEFKTFKQFNRFAPFKKVNSGLNAQVQVIGQVHMSGQTIIFLR